MELNIDITKEISDIKITLIGENSDILVVLDITEDKATLTLP